jgi:hypothetical protein
MAMWDYKTLKISTEFQWPQGTDFDERALEMELQSLGKEGWELVSTFSVERRQGGSRYVIAVLKKRID